MRFRFQSFNWLALGFVLLVSALPFHATFPGKNGRIAFGRLDPSIGWIGLFTADKEDNRVLGLSFWNTNMTSFAA